MPGFKIGGNGDGISNFAEFHRQHRWKIESLGLPSGTGTPAQNKLALFAQTLQLPSIDFEEEKIKTGTSIVYSVVKKAKWKPVTVKFYDTYGLFKVFDEWREKMWTEKEGIKAPSVYKGNPKFVLTDGKGVVKQSYELIGAYPKHVNHGDLSYASSEVKLLVVTFSYDYAKIKLEDEPSQATKGNSTGGTRARGGDQEAISPGINDPSVPFNGIPGGA